MQKFTDILSSWQAGSLSLLEAANQLGLGERQFRRYRSRHEEDGEAGLLDRRIGKPSPRAIAAGEQAAMLELYRNRHVGWTAKHFHEHGVRHHRFSWGYSWTKTQLHAAGLLERAPRRGAHRRKRERKPCAGMMLHQDGSRHGWLAGKPPLDLIVTMDDATSEIYAAILVEEEGTMSTFQSLRLVFERHGLPCQLYTDRGSHYFHTPAAGGKVDKHNPTQVGRALKQLGVEHIAAYSPEARGRSERMFATLQDRMLKELALAGITEVEAANHWIATVYLPEHNRRFSQPAAVAESGFVKVSDSTSIAEALAIEEERTVGRDNTVSFERMTLQIPPSSLRAHFVKAHVTVRAYPDGTFALFLGPRCIARHTADGVLCAASSPAPSTPPSAASNRQKGHPEAPSVPSPGGRVKAWPRGAELVARASQRPTLTRPPGDSKGRPSRNEQGCVT